MEEIDNEEKEKDKRDSSEVEEITGACEKRLDSLWSNVVDILDSDNDDKQKVCELKEEVPVMTNALIEASNNEKLEHVVCNFCNKHQPFHRIYNWTGNHREHLKVMACEQLKYFKEIMSSGGISIVTSRHIIIPMYLLLLSLKPQGKRRAPLDVELLYITILYYLSKKIVNFKLLDILSHDLHTEEGFQIDRFSFFELLIGYTHQPGEVGNIARDGILFCVKASISHQEFSHYIIHESSGCNIIAAGLSGRYSSLPNTLELHDDDWHCLTKFDIQNMKELREFLNTLKFCCTITEAGNNAVTSKLLSLIHEGFLTSVLAPLLNQSSVESQVATTAYLELFIRSITSANVMKIFLKCILTERYDNISLVDTLISHINSQNSHLSIITLQFFKTLLELNCEDVLYRLVFRYLIGCYHVVPNQKRTIKEVDFYCRSATMFLYLTPQCCIEANKYGVENDVDNISLFNLDSLTPQKLVEASTPELKRQTSGDSLISKCSNISNPELPYEQAIQFKFYLHNVKRTIVSCKKACSCWSAVYDGMDVTAEDANLDRHGSGSNNSFMDALLNGGIAKVPNLSLKISSPKSRKIDFSLNNGDSRCLGPFMNSIFDKIESMLDNNLYVNLMLTSLVSRLACYSQPLLRSFLLNSNLVIKPGVRSLVQVITRVSSIADDLVWQLDDFKILIINARKILQNRELSNLDILISSSSNNNDGEASFTVELDCKTGASKFERHEIYDRDEKGSIDIFMSPEMLLQQKNKSLNTSEITRNSNYMEANAMFNSPPEDAGRLHPVLPKLSSRSPKRNRNKLSKNEIAELRKRNPNYIRNAIYCVIILEEFMKELAAISIEQTLL